MHVPESCVDHVRIAGVYNQIHDTCFYASRVRLFPVLPPSVVRYTPRSSLVLEMAERGDIDDVGVLRMYLDERADVKRVFQCRRSSRFCLRRWI